MKENQTRCAATPETRQDPVRVGEHPSTGGERRRNIGFVVIFGTALVSNVSTY
jgi:hypothetical protein